MSFLPTDEAVFVPAGRLYARRPTETRPADFGLTRLYEFTPEVEEVELRNNNNGIDAVFTTRAKTVGGTVNIELDLVTARNLAFWAYGEHVFHTQESGTALVVEETDVIAGQITKLAGLDVTAVVITDGAAVDPVTYVAGVHYALDAAAGVVRWLQDIEAAEITYSRPAIVSADAKSVIRVLNAGGGIEVILTLVGTSDIGQRVLIEGQKVRLTPNGSMAGISQDADFGVLSLQGTLLYNDADPDEPFGRITLL